MVAKDQHSVSNLNDQSMSEKQFPGLSREAEEQRLQETLTVVQDNLNKYREEVSALRTGIDDMLAHFHDDNPELINELENAYTMHDFLSNTLVRNERALKKPYFGRIDFHDESTDTQETYYIGRSGIFRDVIHPIVIDWRAPVANVYYENGLGRSSYRSPKGENIGIDLQLKRTYEIENGQLQNIFDTETIANDDILTKYLSKNKQAVLGEIVATIQKEQNEIIRKSPLYNCLVQGVAGSGKTTVAMHRISYILYNYADRFKPEDFYIVGSNRLLLNYITGVLPDLDVYGVRQMTMEQLFVRLLYEDWDEHKYRIKPVDTKKESNMVKGRLAWFRDLEAFCQRLERKVISRESIYLDPREFVEGFVDGKVGVHDRRDGKPADPSALVLLMDGGGLDEFLSQYPNYSIQSKVDLLNERLNNRIKDEFLGKGVKYTEAERKAILKAYRGRYGAGEWKTSIFAIYQDFLNEQFCKGYEVDATDRAFDVYDLAALAYLYKRVKETEVISEAHHIVIDEAQDFGMMVYSVLKYCIKDCTYTIMGDVSQNIHFGYGLNDWEALKALYINDKNASFGILKKSYRNTVEISKFATEILHHGRFAVYPVEPIIRHGDEPVVCEVRSHGKLVEKAVEVCREWQRKGLETIAVICRDGETARKTAEELAPFVHVLENDPEKATFGSGIMVLPVEYTKGLEFDAVLIMDPTRAEYPVDDGHAKLLYVAATRALHELCVLHTGDLTGLIADPVPEESVRVIGASGQSSGKENIPGRTDGKDSEPADGKGKLPGQDVQPVIRPRMIRRAAERQDGSELMRKAEQARSGSDKTVGMTESGSGRKAELPKAGIGRSTRSEWVEDDDKLAILRNKQKLNIQNTSEKVTTRPSPAAEKPDKSFGSMPDTAILRAQGHARTDQAIRWVSRGADGLYLKSAYGTLRISPVDSRIIRVTFTRGNRMPEDAHPQIALTKPIREWMYRESPKLLELKTDDLCLQVDKANGCIYYMTRDKAHLLAERGKECRLAEKTSGSVQMRQYFEWPKNEALFALSAGAKAELSLKGAARYISYGDGAKLPAVISEKGYALLIASDGPVCCCDVQGYGGHILAENTEILDYYFLVGSSVEELVDFCNCLRCKK